MTYPPTNAPTNAQNSITARVSWLFNSSCHCAARVCWIGLGLQMPCKCPYKWPANGLQMAIHTTPLYPRSICKVLPALRPAPSKSSIAAKIETDRSPRHRRLEMSLTADGTQQHNIAIMELLPASRLSRSRSARSIATMVGDHRHPPSPRHHPSPRLSGRSISIAWAASSPMVTIPERSPSRSAA